MIGNGFKLGNIGPPTADQFLSFATVGDNKGTFSCITIISNTTTAAITG